MRTGVDSRSEFQSPAKTGVVTELVNGRFVDVIAGRYFADFTRMLIADGRILALTGGAGTAKGIKPHYTIDLKGGAVIPGLFNTHCHIQMTFPSIVTGVKDLIDRRRFGQLQVRKSMADCIARGITVIRDAHTDDLTCNRRLREKIAKGGMPGPRIYQAVAVHGDYSRKESGFRRWIHGLMGLPYVSSGEETSGVVLFAAGAGERAVRDAVDRAIDERGADHIKLYEPRKQRINHRFDTTPITHEQLEAVADQARLRGIRTTMHHTTVEGFRSGFRAGISSLAHIPLDKSLAPEDVDAFKKSGCIIEPTLSLAYCNCWGDRKVNRHFESVPQTKLTEFREANFRAFASDYWVSQLCRDTCTGFDRILKRNYKALGFLDVSYVFRNFSGYLFHGINNLNMLVQGGAKIACGNDAGIPPLTEAMLGLELSMFDLAMNNGGSTGPLRGAEALRMATMHSAEALGVEKDFGSLDAGKKADLVVVNGDPLADYRIIGSRAAAVFVDGRLVSNECNLATIPYTRGSKEIG